MNQFANEKKILGRREYFPNAKSIAYFSPYSQTIQLNTLTRQSLFSAMEKPNTSETRRHLGIMFHEITHWADMIATRWGRDYLSRIYEAHHRLNGRADPADEYTYSFFVELHDAERRIMMPQYYRYISRHVRPHDHRHTWGIQFSAGREFDAYGRPDDSRPILFVRFLDRESRELVVRQPIVVGALMETTAVWSEMYTSQGVIQGMESFDRIMEQKEFDREVLRNLYTTELTLYSAPVHLLAHYARISDAALAYLLGSCLSHIVLNLDPIHFSALRLPKSMEPWGAMFGSFQRQLDPAFAFAVICANGEPWMESNKPATWIDKALVASGLPKSSDIYASAKEYMVNQKPNVGGGWLSESEKYLLALGLDYFNIRSNGDSPYLDPSMTFGNRLATPPMFSGEDGELIMLPPVSFDMGLCDPYKMHEAEWRLNGWTRNFLSACR